MKVVIQRVSSAAVSVGGETVARIGQGLLVLVGVAQGDGEAEARGLARKTAEMRIFADADSKFNQSLLDVGGEALVVSQFTLLANARKGRRPSFTGAAPPDVAEPLVATFAQAMRDMGVAVQTGRFGAHMAVALVNDGPVTIVLDSRELSADR